MSFDAVDNEVILLFKKSPKSQKSAIYYYNLGLLHDLRFKDYDEAEKNYKKACELGYVFAFYRLANLYENNLPNFF